MVAAQNQRVIRSSPSARAISAAKIGVVPRISAVVDAFVKRIA